MLNQPPPFFKIAGNQVRWNLLTSLAQSDLRVQELVSILQESQNLVSYHLKLLSEYNLVHERHSSADGREIYYSLDLDRVRNLFFASGAALHPSLKLSDPFGIDRYVGQSVRVLFMCTHNSARSQIAEGILRWRSHGDIAAFSAGTEPTSIHPSAIQIMSEMGIDIRNQRSKHLNEFLDEHFDYIITVCDRARENCPIFPGTPEMIHWSFPDPIDVKGEVEHYAAFKETARQLNTRIGYLLLFLNRKESV